MNLSNDVVIHKKLGEVEVLQFRKLLEFPNVKHAYALKNLNFRRYENGESKYSEYEKLLNAIDIEPKTLVKQDQKHTDNILEITRKQNEEGPDIYLEYLEGIDATITNKENITLASTNADCILIMFYDPMRNVIANVHSGWRGTFQKISQKVVRKMKSDYGCRAEDILCFICPSIRMCHFEVEEDVKNPCEEIFNYTGKLDEMIKIGRVVNGTQKYNIDTVLINKSILEEEGIKAENIYDSNICSVCKSEKVHSRRVEGPDFGVGTAVIIEGTIDSLHKM